MILCENCGHAITLIGGTWRHLESGGIISKACSLPNCFCGNPGSYDSPTNETKKVDELEPTDREIVIRGIEFYLTADKFIERRPKAEQILRALELLGYHK